MVTAGKKAPVPAAAQSNLSHWAPVSDRDHQRLPWPLLVATVGPNGPEVGLSGPSSALPVASPGANLPDVGPSRAGPVPASHWPLQVQPLLPSWQPPQVQLFLLAVSTGPRPASRQPLFALLLASSWRPCLCRSEASSSGAFQAYLLPPGGLHRPSSYLTVASLGPALAFLQPPQDPLLPGSGFPGPSSCLPLGCIHRPSSSLTLAH
ncbi:hypothetical protein AAY473_031912 [Plecturocebus cupreus]